MNKIAFKVFTTINKWKEEDMKYGDETISLGFLDKVFRLRNELSKYLQKSQKRNGVIVGFDVKKQTVHKIVLYINPMFKKLLKPAMEERTLKDRIKRLFIYGRIIKSTDPCSFDFSESWVLNADKYHIV